MPRRVLVATPCYDGKIDVWYASSLVECVKLAQTKDIEIIPIWLSFDALVQRARNDLVKLAVNGNMDDIIWIDNDIEWNPDWFFRLLDYPVDVVGGTYRKKTDEQELYVIKIKDEILYKEPETGLIEVAGLGTGFVRMSKNAFMYLWENSTPYREKDTGKEGRMIFNVTIENGEIISEDTSVFKSLTKGGFKIYLDPDMTCTHLGYKKYPGNFLEYIKYLDKMSKESTPDNKETNTESSGGIRKLYE